VPLAPFVPSPATVRAVITLAHPLRPQCVMVTHWRPLLGTPGPYTAGALVTLADSIMTHLCTGLAAHTFSHASWLDVLCTDLTSATAAQGRSTHAPIAGGDANAGLPPSQALCCSLDTGLRSRSARGRMFIPGRAVTELTHDGGVDPASASALVTAIGAANTLINADTAFGQAVASRKLATSRLVTGWTVSTIVRSQRRRESDH